MPVSLRILRTIRFFLLIKLVQALALFSTAAADFVGERSGLNDALRGFLERQKSMDAEGRSGLPLYATCDRRD